MKVSKNIFGWLGMKQEALVLDDARKHVEVTFQTVDWFRKAVSAFITGDDKRKKEAIEKVRECEHQADDQKRVLIETIIHAKLEPTSLLLTFQLAEYLEGVTDKIEDAADFIKVVAIRSK